LIKFVYKNEEKIYQVLRKHFLKYSDFKLHPHLSLIYKNNMPVDEKIKVIKKIKIPAEILFDQIKVITALNPLPKKKMCWIGKQSPILTLKIDAIIFKLWTKVN
jgi:hypothetical protein